MTTDAHAFAYLSFSATAPIARLLDIDPGVEVHVVFKDRVPVEPADLLAHTFDWHPYTARHAAKSMILLGDSGRSPDWALAGRDALARTQGSVWLAAGAHELVLPGPLRDVLADDTEEMAS